MACDEPAEAVDPGEAALNDPPVAPQPLAGLEATACNTGRDRATAAGLSAAPMVVSLVGGMLSSSRPCRSVIKWRSVPSLPRSVGFDPVLSPQWYGVHRVKRHPLRAASSCRTRSGSAMAPGEQFVIDARAAGKPL